MYETKSCWPEIVFFTFGGSQHSQGIVPCQINSLYISLFLLHSLQNRAASERVATASYPGARPLSQYEEHKPSA